MRYLPYFVIISILILLVFAGLLWLKPEPDPKLAIIAIEREISEEKLKAKGLKPELLQELKDEALDLRIVELLVEKREALLPDAKAKMEALQVEKDRIVRRLKSQARGTWTESRIWKWFMDRRTSPDFKAAMEALPQVEKDRYAQEMKSEDIGPWILNPPSLKMLLDRIETDRLSDSEEYDDAYALVSSEEWMTARKWREARSSYESLKESLTKKDVKWRYDPYKRQLDRALDHRGLKPAAIDELSMEELKDIYDAHQRKVRRYAAKFNLVEPRHKYDARMKALAQSSIFSYEGDGKVSISIPHEEMTPEQKEHLGMIHRYIDSAEKGRYETKIIVEADDPEIWRISYVQILPVASRDSDALLVQFVIERKKGRKFSGLDYDKMKAFTRKIELAKASIFSYEGDSKVRVSIPPEQMTAEQQQHLKLIKAHIEYARKGHYETKIIVQLNDEAVKITYIQILPGTVLGRSHLVQFVIEHKTGKRLGISYW